LAGLSPAGMAASLAARPILDGSRGRGAQIDPLTPHQPLKQGPGSGMLPCRPRCWRSIGGSPQVVEDKLRGGVHGAVTHHSTRGAGQWDSKVAALTKLGIRACRSMCASRSPMRCLHEPAPDILTALTLEKPRAGNEIKRRFLTPLTQRLFGGYPGLDCAAAIRSRFPLKISSTFVRCVAGRSC
jgi:hypothetical protein